MTNTTSYLIGLPYLHLREAPVLVWLSDTYYFHSKSRCAEGASSDVCRKPHNTTGGCVKHTVLQGNCVLFSNV